MVNMQTKGKALLVYVKSKYHHFSWSAVGHGAYQKYMTENRDSLL